MLLVAMLSHSASVGALVCTVMALEAVDDRDDGLWETPVQWQWHTVVVVRPLPLLEIRIKLLPDLAGDSVLIAQMSIGHARAQRVLAVGATADNHVVFCILC